MTDEVDTDALRESARDLVAASYHARRPYRRPYQRFAMQMAAAAGEIDRLWDNLFDRENEIDRLQRALAKAPHDVDTCERCTYDGYKAERSCTCWKAELA